MEKSLSITFLILILLTISTAALSNVNETLTFWLVSGILGISFVKVLLVAFNFMDLKKAHGFWKFSIVFISGLTVLGILMMR
ncbi:MAG: cytochrome C oxidase subunit IV family protein [Ignavibacteria bacterium]|nr:cytochrome C oxidase subunit IV family protein [Ignavibacteria bacterium]